MKKVTEITAKALAQWKTKKLWNSEVCYGLSTYDYYLHDNLIAMYEPYKNRLWISDAGRQTNTTKERLNWILRQFKLWRIFQKDYKWYLSDETWLHEWTWQKEFNWVERDALFYNQN